MRFTTSVVLALFLCASTGFSQTRDKQALEIPDDLKLDFKSEAANEAVEKYADSIKTLKSLVAGRIKLQRAEVIDKLIAEQTNATKEGKLEEAIKLRDTVARLEQLQKSASSGESLIAQGERAAGKVRIPKGSVRFGKSRYYAFASPMTWHVARDYCNSLGGHLIRIETKKEHEFIAGMISRRKSRNIYLWSDGSDEVEEGQFIYSNGKPVKYIRWDAGKPNKTRAEHFLCLSSESGLFHDGNSIRHPFICEWD